MKVYEAGAEIGADPATIWTILTDAAGYPSWDSGVIRIDGRIDLGEKIKLWAELNPKRGIAVRVTEFVPGERMAWTGGAPLGLFKGVRTFTLRPDGDGTTAFRMREEFTGPMLPLIWPSMPDFGPAFAQFAAGLKQRAEASG